MESVGGARVVIVDDDLNEVGPLLKALSRRQIPSCWFNGDVNGLPSPSDRLNQVRLAFLDIDLQGAGAADRAKIAQLVNVVVSLLSPDAVGFGVILWTKHANLREPFITEMIRAGAPTPLFVVPLDKTACKRGGAYDLAIIARRLKACLGRTLPWRVLWRWERDCFDASGQLVREVAAVTKPTTIPTARGLSAWQGIWGNSLSTLLLALAREELGENNVTSGNDVIKGAYSALTPLQADSIDSRAADSQGGLRVAGQKVLDRHSATPPSRELVGQINSRLLLTPFRNSAILSGNVYVGGRRSFRKLFKALPSKTTVVSDVSTCAQPNAILERLELVFVEISPVCDYTQRKIRQSRLVAGLIYPESASSQLAIKKQCDFLLKVGPFRDGAENRHLVLDFRHLLSCAAPSLRQVQSRLKLRTHVSGHIQSRFAAHATRAGILTLR